MIQINLEKAKALAHEKRRAARAAEFEPHDNVIAKQIPGVDFEAAEAARQAIRDKYNAMQAQIDAAQSPEQLLPVIQGL
jgi:hypothetical protein